LGLQHLAIFRECLSKLGFFFLGEKLEKGGKMAYRAHCDVVLMAAVHSWKCPNFRSCLFFEYVGFKKKNTFSSSLDFGKIGKFWDFFLNSFLWLQNV
jgi:hypothetical protein